MLSVFGLLGATAIFGCADRELPDGVVARVGSTVISSAQVEQEVLRARSTRGPSHASLGPPAYSSCRGRQEVRAPTSPNQTVALIIRSKHDCSNEYRALHIAAVRTLVRAAWLRTEARRRGMPWHREDVALHSVVMALQDQIAADVPIRGARIKQYYHRHRNSFGPPRVRDAWFLRTVDYGASVQARRNLDHSGSWEDTIATAIERSRSTARGDAFSFTESQMRNKEFEALLFGAKVEKIIGPIKALKSWYLIQVIKERSAPSRPPLEAAHLIRTKLQRHALEQALRARYAPMTYCADKYQHVGISECN